MALCGDSIRAGAGSFREECDDGNARDGDGCSAACRVEFGFGCRDTTSNLAPNGDFIMGRVGFTSDYTFDDSRNLMDGFGGGGPVAAGLWKSLVLSRWPGFCPICASSSLGSRLRVRAARLKGPD